MCGVLCVKAFAVAESGFDMSKVGNMSLFGGVFIMPLFYFAGAKLFKRPSADVFDIFSVCMIFKLRNQRVLSGAVYTGNALAMADARSRNCVLHSVTCGADKANSERAQPRADLSVIYEHIRCIPLCG